MKFPFKYTMAKNSLFAILLRSSWWISTAIGLALALVCLALLPAEFKLVGAASALPFLVIGVIAAARQWKRPSAARVASTVEAVSAMPWPAFASLLEQAFRRDGYAVTRVNADAFDFELERAGRHVLVSARRWKSARIGLEALKALQAAREKRDASGAFLIGLGALSDNARPYAAANDIAVWQAEALALALQGQPLRATTPA